MAHRRKGKRTIVFFCHPYSAFERGSNENMNRLIRCFFPKGSNFDTMNKEQVAAAESWVNNYPLKLLGWKSAASLLDYELKAADRLKPHKTAPAEWGVPIRLACHVHFIVILPKISASHLWALPFFLFSANYS